MINSLFYICLKFEWRAYRVWMCYGSGGGGGELYFNTREGSNLSS